MFPVKLILIDLEDEPRTGGEVLTLFEHDMQALGGTYRGSITMTVHPFGVGVHHRYSCKPTTIVELARLIEYTQRRHHGFKIVAVRPPEYGSKIPSVLSFR